MCPQPPCALRVTAARGHLRRWGASPMLRHRVCLASSAVSLRSARRPALKLTPSALVTRPAVLLPRAARETRLQELPGIRAGIEGVPPPWRAHPTHACLPDRLRRASGARPGILRGRPGRRVACRTVRHAASRGVPSNGASRSKGLWLRARPGRSNASGSRGGRGRPWATSSPPCGTSACHRTSRGAGDRHVPHPGGARIVQ